MPRLPKPAHAPAAAPRRRGDATAVVTARLRRWYAHRGLRLPPDVQAEFTAMGMEAIARAPGHAPHAVMDELLGELDGMLGHVPPAPGVAAWWQRLRRAVRASDRGARPR